MLLMQALDSSPVTARQIKSWTDHDPVLAKVRDLLLQGWQHSDDAALAPYQRRLHELSVHDGCVLWGNRVVVPPPGRARVIEELHEGHPGISRMKSLARSFVWWPQLDQEIEEKVKTCNSCQNTRHQPPSAPLHPWEWPQRPWVRLHADYAGPMLGHTFLIVVDSHSKWIEVKAVTSSTSKTTITQLRSIFATHGLPEMLVTDNGTPFTSSEFQEFMKVNGIRHVRTAPYHPASNGLAERAVQTFKEGIKKCQGESIETRLSRFLYRYRNTPHTTTGTTPSELLLGRRVRTHLDLLKPNLTDRIQNKQQQQKTSHDVHTKERHFQAGNPVFVRNLPLSSAPTWLPGKITAVHGPLTYIIQLEDGRHVRRHVDHIRPRDASHGSTSTPDDWIPMPIPTVPPTASTTTTEDRQVDQQPRRSTRVTRPPDRFSH